MTQEELVEALNTEKDAAARYLLQELWRCSDESGGCEGCPARRRCVVWWDRFGCDCRLGSVGAELRHWREFTGKRSPAIPQQDRQCRIKRDRLGLAIPV